MNTDTSAAESVAASGGTITVHHRAGRGPTLVFLHYWGGSATTWAAVQHRLAGRETVAWDQRGWGDQAHLTGPYGLDALADDVESVAAALDLTDAVLVGHSQGGKVAQLVAHQRPAWLRGLVLVAPAPPRPAPSMTPDHRDRLSHAYDTAETAARAIDTVLTAAPLPAPTRARAIRDSIAAAPGARREWPTRGIAATLGTGTIALPTAVVVGEHDRVEPPQVLRELLMPTLTGAATLSVVPGAGHLLPLEAPHAVADAVARVCD